jgi:5-methylcytosine-specific restriction endonuclease McrA
MTKRLEFPAKIRDQAFARSAGKCEKCGMPFGSKRPEYDHILPDALGGKPELANCMVICSQCHKDKTAQDVGRIRKADRQRKKQVGAVVPKAPIASPPKREREHKPPVAGVSEIMRRIEQ